MEREDSQEISYEQSAVVPYRWMRGALHIYLITSLKKRHWIIPKGLVEDGLSQIETVLVETYEEAGLVGLVGDRPVGFYRTEKWGGVCNITVYPMKVLAELSRWPECDLRERVLVDYDTGIWRTMITDQGLLAVVGGFGGALGIDSPSGVPLVAGDPHLQQ